MDDINRVDKAVVPSFSCTTCTQAPRCLPAVFNPDAFGKLKGLVNTARILQAGEPLFRTGERFEALHIIHSGSLKLTTVDNNGGEIVIGLFLPTDVAGFKAIAACQYPYTAVANETSSYCSISYNKILHLSEQNRQFNTELAQLLSRSELNETRHRVLLQACRKSYQRVAAFMLYLAQRFEAIGYAGRAFRIPLKRGELASFLGLTIETVSRDLHTLHERKLLQLDGRSVHILQPAALQEVAGVDPDLLQI